MHWTFSKFTGGTTLPFNASSDGSWLNYDGTDNGAIELEGEILNYNSVWDDKKQHYTIRFQAKSNNELFDVRIILYPNLKSYITLSSSARTSITYIGKVSGIKDDEV